MNLDRATKALHRLIAAAVIIVGSVLAVRAAVRLEERWDTFHYHIPFAAIRGGLGVPYTPDDVMARFFEGFPPLPHLLQGVLWRLTGSINATGTINIIAFAAMLALAHRHLGRRGHVVALVALTTPLVLIHTAVSYVDLFGNSALALGFGVILYRQWASHEVVPKALPIAIGGLIVAAWSKFMLAPIAAVGFIALAAIEWRAPWRSRSERRRVLIWIGLGLLLANLTYLDNFVRFGNPFWPVRLPIDALAEAVPFAIDVRQQTTPYRPPPLAHLPDWRLFWLSLFEVGHPTSYPDRARWIIDQGQSWESFRMGGFWGVHVVACGVSVLVSALALDRRRGAGLIASLAVMLVFVSFLPRSHDLRYYMFLPLVWALVIGFLHGPLSQAHPRVAAGLLAVHLAMFLWVLPQNRAHLRIHRYGYADAAAASVAPQWWAVMTPGETYCAVRFAPIAFLLTGPTMSEHTIIARTRAELCPEGTKVIVQPPGRSPPAR